MKKILVWDKHTRLFHWFLVVFIVFSLATGLANDMDMMEYHMLSGYTLMALLLFRVMTGLLGGDYANFSKFPIKPREVIGYIKGGRHYYGHNPLGSLMILTFLMVILTQVLSGFMTSDDIFLEGPWVAFVNEEWVSLAGTIHGMNYYLLLFLISTHVFAVIYYEKIKNQDLIVPMFTGLKNVDGRIDDQHEATVMSYRRLVMILLISCGLSWFLVTFS
ncbi:MAG: cytochrome b [Gammaproteobacteria bacterium]|jgi:cytochrome b